MTRSEFRSDNAGAQSYLSRVGWFEPAFHQTRVGQPATAVRVAHGGNGLAFGGSDASDLFKPLTAVSAAVRPEVRHRKSGRLIHVSE